MPSKIPGTIEKRGKGSWRIGIQVRDESGKWQWIRRTIHVDPLLPEAKQRKEAGRQLVQLTMDIRMGRVSAEHPRITFGAFSQFWFTHHVSKMSAATQSSYQSFFKNHVLPDLAAYPLHEVRSKILTEWLSDVASRPPATMRKDDSELSRKRTPSDRAKLSPPKKTLSAATVKHIYDAVYNMFQFAVEMEYLESNPMLKVKRPKAKKPKINFLSEEQALELLRCLAKEENPSYRIGVLLALLCGLRLGEVDALRISDIDYKNKSVDIAHALKYSPETGAFIDDPKTESSIRPVSLPDGIMPLLESERDYQLDLRRRFPDFWPAEGWLVHNWCGQRLHHDTLSKWWRKFAEANGFPGVRFHDLRHTHATILLANNVDVVTVAQRMGHSDPSTTLRIYAHALKRRDVDSANAMQAVLLEGSAPLKTVQKVGDFHYLNADPPQAPSATPASGAPDAPGEAAPAAPASTLTSDAPAAPAATPAEAAPDPDQNGDATDSSAVSSTDNPHPKDI